MRKIYLILLVTLALAACSKSENSGEKTSEKVFSQSAILAEWKAMGDSSPLLKEANVDCMADVDKGISWTVSKGCIAASVVGNIKRDKLIDEGLKK